MCKRTRNFLFAMAISQVSVAVFETAYYSYHVITHQEELTRTNLAITAFINFSIIFFAAVLIIGLLKPNLALLKVWIIYSFIELLRSSIHIYQSWVDPKDVNFEKLFNICDAALQISTIITVAIIIKISRKYRNDELKISTLGQSIELNKKLQNLDT